MINPLVNWIWFGFAVIAHRHGHRAAAGARLQLCRGQSAVGDGDDHDDAARRCWRCSEPRRMRARSTSRAGRRSGHRQVAARAGNAEEADLHVPDVRPGVVSECTCSKAVEMRAELAKLVDDGKSEQQIVDYYIAKYGSQEPLASPIDRGFNRLAWAVPVRPWIRRPPVRRRGCRPVDAPAPGGPGGRAEGRGRRTRGRGARIPPRRRASRS